MPSQRLVAFTEELRAAMREQQPRAEQLILRVPGEGHAALSADSEAELLAAIGEHLAEPVQDWVRCVQALATTERAWGPSERAREAARGFAQATERFFALWEALLRVQPATEPMRHVLGLVHQGCYELFLTGPRDLLRSCEAIVAGEAEARLDFAPDAPSLRDATHELRKLRA